MKPIHPCVCVALAFAGVAALPVSTALAGQKEMKQVEPVTPPESWAFKLAIPGWLAATSGTVGVGNVSSKVYMGADTLIRHLDAIATVSAEARKGRFGIYGDLLYVSASDGVETSGLVSKVNLRLDQYLADMELFYRVVESPRGFLDVRAGVRYTNIYNEASISPNDRAIDQASERFVNALASDIETLLKKDLRRVLDGQNPVLPIPPLNADQKVKIIEIIRAAKADPELAAAVKAQAQAATAEVKAAAQARIDAAKNRVQSNLASALKKSLNRTASLAAYWFDPYIGLRGQYNFSKAWYLTGKGDIGGFGVGSELTWQLYGALGCQISRHVYAEAGYRYLYTDYHQNGFIYDITQSGAQLTIGINF